MAWSPLTNWPKDGKGIKAISSHTGDGGQVLKSDWLLPNQVYQYNVMFL